MKPSHKQWTEFKENKAKEFMESKIITKEDVLEGF